MSHNPNMTTTERVLWRQLTQAAFEAARAPEVEARAKALNKALAGSKGWRLPDLRPLPCACFMAFLTLAKGWAPETNPALRRALAARLEALADAAGDILDGLRLEPETPPAWAERKDIGG